MQQQFAIALCRMIAERAELVLGDVRVAQPDLAIVDGGKRVDQGRAAGPQRLHLSAGEHHAGLNPLADVVVVQRLLVARDHLLALFAWHEDS